MYETLVKTFLDFSDKIATNTFEPTNKRKKPKINMIGDNKSFWYALRIVGAPTNIQKI